MCVHIAIGYRWFVIEHFVIVHLYRGDSASNGWATSWMSGIALAILVITLISGAIFALYWARKNKRNMKASYPGKC